mmetsp:Transcript_18844/g.59205  ORF Transcript_18844/g.59205 Transcript_18844/m.59205 type:complete len:239 (+) Transcript_18844:545-1261(+)
MAARERLLRGDAPHLVRGHALPLGAHDHHLQAARQLDHGHWGVLLLRQVRLEGRRPLIRNHDPRRPPRRRERPRFLLRRLLLASRQLLLHLRLRPLPQTRHADDPALQVWHGLLQQPPLPALARLHRHRQRRARDPRRRPPSRPPRRAILRAQRPRRHLRDAPQPRLRLVRLGDLGDDLRRRRRPQQDPRHYPRLPPLPHRHLQGDGRLHYDEPLRRLHVLLREVSPDAPGRQVTPLS